MAAPKYEEIIVPLTRAQILEDWIAVLKAAGAPTDSWGPTDEPRATIEGASEVLVDGSTMIAAIGRMGVVGTTANDGATGKALDFLASDWFGEERDPAVTAKGAITLTETAGTPHTYVPRELMLESTADPSLIYFNESGFTLAALGTASPVFVAESPGSKYNVDSSTLALSTPIAGVTFSATAGLGWLSTSGEDEESDEELRARLRAKWGSVTATGAVDGYKYHALKSSSEVSRVFVQEDPMANATLGDPAVTVIVAGPTGPISGSALTTVNTYMQARRPLGIIVEVQNCATLAFELRGDITIKTGTRATVEAAVNTLLGEWFQGKTITVNGEALEGLQIGSRIYIAQIIEIVLAIPGVVSFVPKDGAGAVRVPGSGDVTLAGDTVATLTIATSSASWTWTEVP